MSAGNGKKPPPRLVLAGEEGLEGWIDRLEVLVSTYPWAASAVVRALVAEGRAYAATPEGMEMKKRLAGGEWVRLGRVLWEAGGLSALASSDGGAPTGSPAVLPSQWVTALGAKLGQADIEALIERMLQKGARGEAADGP